MACFLPEDKDLGLWVPSCVFSGKLASSLGSRGLGCPVGGGGLGGGWGGGAGGPGGRGGGGEGEGGGGGGDQKGS